MHEPGGLGRLTLASALGQASRERDAWWPMVLWRTRPRPLADAGAPGLSR